MEFGMFCVVDIALYEFPFYLRFLCEKTHLHASLREMSIMDAYFDK